MKKLISFLIISASLVTLASCKDKQDDMLLLMTGDQRRTPQDVPGNDLQVVPSNTYDGGGQVVAIVGDSESPADTAAPVETAPETDQAPSGATPEEGTSGSTEPATSAPETGTDTSTGSGETGTETGSTGSPEADDSGSKGGEDDQDGDHEHADHDDKGDDHEHADHDDKGDDHEHADHDDKGDDDEHAGHDDEGEDEDHDGGHSLVRHGEDFCFAEGAWYKDANTIFTYENKPIGFCFNNLKQGKYEAVVMAKHWFKKGAKNKTVLPGLTKYQVKIAGDGDTKTVEIPVDPNNWEQSSSVVDLVGGDTMVMVNWENPYCEANSCANIQILSLHLKKVGKSDRSAIAAYLLNFSKSNYLMLLTVLVLAVAAIAAINMKQKMSRE